MILGVLNVIMRITQVAIIAALAVYFVKAEPVSFRDMAEKWKELNE